MCNILDIKCCRYFFCSNLFTSFYSSGRHWCLLQLIILMWASTELCVYIVHTEYVINTSHFFTNFVWFSLKCICMRMRSPIWAGFGHVQNLAELHSTVGSNRLIHQAFRLVVPVCRQYYLSWEISIPKHDTQGVKIYRQHLAVIWISSGGIQTESSVFSPLTTDNSLRAAYWGSGH